MKIPNDLIVEATCPKCKRKQKIGSLKSKKCIQCGYAFQIFPKNNVSRIVYCNDTKKLVSLKLGIVEKW